MNLTLTHPHTIFLTLFFLSLSPRCPSFPLPLLRMPLLLPPFPFSGMFFSNLCLVDLLLVCF